MASGRTRDCQGRGSLVELAGWLASRRAPRGAARLICCFIFIIIFLKIISSPRILPHLSLL